MKSRRRKSRRRNRQTILRRRTRSSTSTNGGENSEPIPFDLIIEILLRLPAKSIAKCRCVSKLWSSILRLPYFTDLFMTRSYARHQLLFVCRNEGELLFFSSPPPQYPNENSPLLATNYHMKIPCDSLYTIVSPIGSGLVCTIKADFGKELVICNPSTRQSFTLPMMKKTRMYKRIFLGYDPIEKQLKVLSMSLEYRQDNVISIDHQVLTLGTEKPSWRMIECGVPHYPDVTNGICINGVLYYKANAKGSFKGQGVICFDVRSETYSFVSVMENFIGAVHSNATLINYNGKLASIKPDRGCLGFYGTNRSFEMYILDDPEKQEWSKRVYKLPSLWKNVVGENANLQCVGVSGTNEIVLSSHSPSYPFYVVNYNMERETITKVEIQGMEAFKGNTVFTFVDHVEDVKLMQPF